MIYIYIIMKTGRVLISTFNILKIICNCQCISIAKKDEVHIFTLNFYLICKSKTKSDSVIEFHQSLVLNILWINLIGNTQSGFCWWKIEDLGIDNPSSRDSNKPHSTFISCLLYIKEKAFLLITRQCCWWCCSAWIILKLYICNELYIKYIYWIENNINLSSTVFNEHSLFTKKICISLSYIGL